MRASSSTLSLSGARSLLATAEKVHATHWVLQKKTKKQVTRCLTWLTFKRLVAGNQLLADCLMQFLENCLIFFAARQWILAGTCRLIWFLSMFLSLFKVKAEYIIVQPNLVSVIVWAIRTS